MFVEELCRKFGGVNKRDFVEEFNKLVQEGTMLEYQKQFEHFRALVIIDNTTLSEHFFISSFISRLKPALRLMIRLLKPQSLNQASEQALVQA